MANLRVMKMDGMGMMLGTGNEKAQRDLYNTVQAMNTLMNNNSIQILGENDSYETHQYTFGGIADVYDRFMMDVAGAAETPVTKLFGRSPAGMNATGESDMQNYYDTIEEKQENELRPVYDKLLPIIMMSTFGAVPDDFDYDFNPVRRAPEDEMADLASKNTDSVTKAFQAGLISQKVALKELRQQSELTGMWTNIGDRDIENADDEVMRPDEGMGGDMFGNPEQQPPEPAGTSEKGEGEQVPKQKEEPPQGKRQEAREG
jgi:phage-related protein (TIGR01555 family)